MTKRKLKLTKSEKKMYLDELNRLVHKAGSRLAIQTALPCSKGCINNWFSKSCKFIPSHENACKLAELYDANKSILRHEF